MKDTQNKKQDVVLSSISASDTRSQSETRLSGGQPSNLVSEIQEL